MVRAVSLDFHDTIAICPAWFRLETRHLVSQVHALLVEGGYLAPGPAPEELDAAYRELRLAIHEHGCEQDALRCVQEVLARFDIRIPDALAEEAIETRQREVLTECQPRPGIRQAVEQLGAAGLPLGVTSNAVYHPFLLWALARFHLLPRFTSVITSASAGFYKSRVEIFHATAEQLGVAPGDLVHIGDSYRFDVKAARAAGLRAIWLNLTGAPAPEPNVADAVITNLDNLAAVVLSLDSPRAGSATATT